MHERGRHLCPEENGLCTLRSERLGAARSPTGGSFAIHAFRGSLACLTGVCLSFTRQVGRGGPRHAIRNAGSDDPHHITRYQRRCFGGLELLDLPFVSPAHRKGQRELLAGGSRASPCREVIEKEFLRHLALQFELIEACLFRLQFGSDFASPRIIKPLKISRCLTDRLTAPHDGGDKVEPIGAVGGEQPFQIQLTRRKVRPFETSVLTLVSWSSIDLILSSEPCTFSPSMPTSLFKRSRNSVSAFDCLSSAFARA